MTTYQGSEELLERTRNSIEVHRDLYLNSGGVEGHIRDFAPVGARGPLPTLLLETIGRKSGRRLIVPLIYGLWQGEWVVVGSKGGAPQHPAWFFNLPPGQDVAFQVATQAYRGPWRLVEGQEREALWRYMADLFPPYDDYAKAAGREIPIVALRPTAEAPLFQAG